MDRSRTTIGEIRRKAMINIQKIKKRVAVRGVLSIGLILLVTSSLFGQSADQSKQADAAAQPGGGGGTQTVNAQQSGSWTIGLDPVRNTVRLANSEADPLPVKVISNGGRKAYQKRISFDIAVGASQGSVSFPIPAGKRFVIENMTAVVRLPPGIQPYLHIFTYMDDGDGVFTFDDSANQDFVLVQQSNLAGLTIWTANHKVVAYADERVGETQINHTVSLQASGNVTLLSKVDITLSGYLEDLPVPQN
jgi:hypothetical protein